MGISVLVLQVIFILLLVLCRNFCSSSVPVLVLFESRSRKRTFQQTDTSSDIPANDNDKENKRIANKSKMIIEKHNEKMK